MAVRCILATGWTLDEVLHLDILTFNALMERITKITYSDRAEAAWVDVATVNAGMSGKTKGVKKLTDAWAGHTTEDLEEIAKKTGRDANGFLRDFNLLRGGRI
jgi:hypothetical protein